MTTRISKALFLVAVLALASLAAARPAQASVRVDIGFFYDSLAPYGTWYEHPSYGWVWAPQAISTSWRPYTDGYWAYADGYGWTWASSDPWGWATDHYGRWFYDDYEGWIWVPGYEWAPAWVDWVSYDGYVGWAPLPPSAYWSVNVGFAPRYSVDYDRYVFVEPRYLGSTSWQRYAAPRERAVRWAREGRRITRYQSYGDRIVNRSVAYAPRTALQVVDVASPTSLRRTIDRGQLTVFRPQVTRNTRIRPPHQARGRGIGMTRQRESQRIAVPPAPRRPAAVERVERERRPLVTAVRPQRTVERVAPAPRRNHVTPRIERSRGLVVGPQRTVRQVPASRRPAITQRVERRPVVSQRMPQRAPRQLAPAPSERRPAQMHRGHERRQAANPPQRPARQKHDKRNGGG
jgi:hypothetical protein